MPLTFRKLQENPPEFAVVNGNDVSVGTFEVLDDGYLYFWPRKENHGAFSSQFMRELADKLDELNAPWDKVVAEALSTPPPSDF